MEIHCEEVVLCGCCIDRIFLTHSYILKGDTQPQCDFRCCLKHIMTYCHNLAINKNKIYRLRIMQDLLALSTKQIQCICKSIVSFKYLF